MTPGRTDNLLWAAPFLVVGPVAALAPRSLLTVLLAACALGLALHLWRERAIPRPSWRIAAPFGLFVAYAGLSASWSIVPASSLDQCFKLLYLLGAASLSAAMLARAPNRALRASSRALVAGIFLGLAILLIDTAAGHPMLGVVHGADESGQPGHPAMNRTLVAFAALIWPAALALAALGARRWSLALPLAFLGFSAFTTSQSATVGIAAGLLAYAVACVSVRTARYLVLAALLIGFAGAVPVARMAYSAGLSEAGSLQESARHRVEVWNFAAERILRRPLLGFGLDSSRAVPNEGDVSRFKSWTDKVIPLHTHSLFLQLWLELGAVGAALGCLIGASLLRAVGALRDSPQRFALAAFSCNVAMAAVTSFSMWQVWWASALIVSGLCLLPNAAATPVASNDKVSR